METESFKSRIPTVIFFLGMTMNAVPVQIGSFPFHCLLPKRIIFSKAILPFSNLSNMRLVSHFKNVINSYGLRCRLEKVKFSNYSFRNYCSGAEVPVEQIRNFSIIAHVDHGKSTLADRFLEITGAIKRSKDNKQVLDRLPVERERGITVKAVSASLNYIHNDLEYQLNLIDTPGHVDFSHEVSRSLSACQGVILLVDANEGVQAQTVANFYLAHGKGLTILPVLNKIDLPQANPDAVEKELKSLFGIDPSTVKRISAKTGSGVEDLLKLVIVKVPYPKVNREAPFKALIIDSWYDNYRGSVLFAYITDGTVKVGTEITSCRTGKNYQVKTVGKLRPDEESVDILRAGEVGVLTCNMKDSKETFVGDTLFGKGKDVGDIETLPSPKPMVFAGLFPRSQDEREELKVAIEKLLLNDPSVSAQIESSPALGYGWRLGFLGYLHLDVFRQRLEQEFDREVVLTAPSLTYRFKITGAKNIKRYGGEEVEITNPNHFPDVTAITEMSEPIVLATIISPLEYHETVFDECNSRRGVEQETTVLGDNRVMIKFKLPLSEIVLDFHDRLKRITSGYASFDYEDIGYVKTSLKKLTVLLNGKEVEELTQIVHSGRANESARKIAAKLKELVPRQQVGIVIQACIGGKVLAREDIKPYRKDVTHKLHGGGDSSRRKKLLKAQAEGKKKMRTFANIEIPRDTFIDVLKEH